VCECVCVRECVCVCVCGIFLLQFVAFVLLHAASDSFSVVFVVWNDSDFVSGVEVKRVKSLIHEGKRIKYFEC